MDEVVDRLPAGYLASNDDGTILGTNRTLSAMLRYDHGTLVGCPVDQILTTPSRIFYQTHVFPLLKVQRRLDEVYLTARTRDGQDVPTLINGRRTETAQGDLNELLLVPMRRRSDYEDQILQARRKAEETNARLEVAQSTLQRQQEELRERNLELETLKKSLEDQVQERTAALQKMIEDLEGFHYSIAHDLRTPLRALHSTSAILLEDFGALLPEEASALLERQIVNVSKLSELMESLLEYSRLSLRPLRRRNVDLTKLALYLIERTGSRELQFEVQPGVHANADRKTIEIVLHHLLGNAIKYSRDGGTIKFGRTTIEGNETYFVSDQGPGIDSKYFERIFLPLERLDREESSGVGIGLAMVKRIVTRHSGRIWVESQPAVGSTFYFTLP